eukprot:gnl/MRDRNA2_/MRDRNA2_104172_c0_seq1.p1 gnl/MRDRNA2_/MRDRNA2_104172_c0~~gnl/MRDRNA2_/MRDRNA2_104172_c0_seq1.p1  ORF type:complete len:970 (-),score=156.97 gnl/MRDRNA2_/MRDRNA2_104172_c0_seq1:107-2620(-)
MTAFSKNGTMSRDDLARGLRSAERLTFTESDLDKIWEEVVSESQLETGKHQLGYAHFCRAFSCQTASSSLHRTKGSSESGGDSTPNSSGSFTLSTKGSRVYLMSSQANGPEQLKGASFKSGQRGKEGKFMSGSLFGCLQDEAQHMDAVTLRRAIFLGLAIDFRNRWGQHVAGYPSDVEPPTKGIPSVRERHEIFNDSTENLIEEWDATSCCGGHVDMKDFKTVEYTAEDGDWTSDIELDGKGVVRSVKNLAADYGIEQGYRLVSVACTGELTPVVDGNGRIRYNADGKMQHEETRKTRITLEAPASKAQVAIEEMCQVINRGGNFDPWEDVLRRRGSLFDGSTLRPFTKGQGMWMWESITAHNAYANKKVTKDDVKRAFEASCAVLPHDGVAIEVLWRLAVREYRGGASASWCDDLVGKAGSKDMHLEDHQITCSTGTGSTRIHASDDEAWRPASDDHDPWIQWDFMPEVRSFAEVWTLGIQSFKLQYCFQKDPLNSGDPGIWHWANGGKDLYPSEKTKEGVQRTSLEPTFDAKLVRLYPTSFDLKVSGMRVTLYGYTLIPRILHDHRCQISFVKSKLESTARVSSLQIRARDASYKVARTVGEALHLGATLDDLSRDYWMGTLRVSRLGYSDAARAPFTEGRKEIAQTYQIGSRGNSKPIALRLLSSVAKFVTTSSRVKELEETCKCDQCGGLGHTAETQHIIHKDGLRCQQVSLKGVKIGCGGRGHETRHCPMWNFRPLESQLCHECGVEHKYMEMVSRCYHCLGLHPDVDEHPPVNHFLACYAPCPKCHGFGHIAKVCPKEAFVDYQDFMRLYGSFAINVLKELSTSSGYRRSA